ncbi:MAG TPA: DUF1259 domain-containing protein [Bacillota bacterium]|nr:DUF1259 domain-containing protein [Bacillota bacterium]
MKKKAIFLSVLFLMAFAVVLIINNKAKLSSIQDGIQQVTNRKAIEAVFGQEGTVQDQVLKLTFPRTDLHVNIGQIPVEPGFALTSWIAFKQHQNQTIIMGDLVLLDQEINPVISNLIANGIDVTALHNHLVGETPDVMYLHYEGHGEALKLAEIMKETLKLTGTPLAVLAARSPGNNDWATVESILGRTGQKKGNLLSFSIPRADKVYEDGMEITPFMGVAMPINFERVGNQVATTGDFVLLAKEVNPVVRALRENGIEITAIHNHMLFETPRLFFLHFWGVGEPAQLAKGIKEALDQTNIVK